MRLTNTIRDAFIRAAMDDVPAAVDHSEAIRKAVVDDAVSQLPPAVQRIWANNETRHFLKTAKHFEAGHITIDVPSCVEYNRDFKLTPSGGDVVKKLVAANLAEREKRRALSDKLHAVAYSVSTRKALVAALPEFEKYLPEDEAKAIRSLPVVANVVAEFMKAGWPKDKAAA